MKGSSDAEHLLVTLANHPELNPDALRALIKATRLLGLACGAQLAQYRNSDEPLQIAFADVRRLAILTRCYEAVSRILSERWQKIPERRRPHYTPHLRFQILELKSLLGLSQKETAQLFAISRNTVARWEQEVAAHPGQETVGSLVRPQPPVRRYADVVRHLVHTMRLNGFGGCQQIAQTLGRAGWKISKRSVGRMFKEKPPQTPVPERTAKSGRAPRARRPNHIWMADITTIPSLFRLFSFKLVVVLDVFSRMPLVAKVFWKEPSARQMGRLIQRAALRFGPPRHFVSDKGTQFTAKRFRKTLRRFGTRQRFGAIGRHGSIATIERFWRTLKDTLQAYVRSNPSPNETSNAGSTKCFTTTLTFDPTRDWAVPLPMKSTSVDNLPISPPSILFEHGLEKDPSIHPLRSLISIQARCFRCWFAKPLSFSAQSRCEFDGRRVSRSNDRGPKQLPSRPAAPLEGPFPLP